MAEPKFHVDKETNPPEVWVLCSTCDEKIRQLQPKETIDVRRAYYCDKHDMGVIVLNTPIH